MMTSDAGLKKYVTTVLQQMSGMTPWVCHVHDLTVPVPADLLETVFRGPHAPCQAVLSRKQLKAMWNILNALKLWGPLSGCRLAGDGRTAEDGAGGGKRGVT